MRLFFPMQRHIFILTGLVLTPLASAQNPPSQPQLQEVLKEVHQYCGVCHLTPPPNILEKKDWPRVINIMADMAEKQAGQPFIPEAALRNIKAFYYGNGPEAFPKLPYFDNDTGPVAFDLKKLGNPSHLPLVARAIPGDLKIGRGVEILLSDGEKNQVILLTKDNKEIPLADLPIPVNTQVMDFDQDGRQDILVAVLGFFPPSDKLAGQVVLLRQAQPGKFAAKTILDGVGRVTDAQAVDIDNDGDLDIAVAVFGGDTLGEVIWLENKGPDQFNYHVMLNARGPINITPIHLNDDKLIDFVTLIAQEHEMVVGMVNKGKDGFEAIQLAQGPHPMYGSTSLRVADLDGDGDDDMVFTNGDNYDLQNDPKPYHGVQWLENKGNMVYAMHDIGRFYGAVNSAVGDMDLDGDMDVVAASWSNFWDDPKRQSIVWFENDGKQNFTRHNVIHEPNGIVSLELEDMNNDGRPDILATVYKVEKILGLFAPPSADKKTPEPATEPRVILLENLPRKKKK